MRFRIRSLDKNYMECFRIIKVSNRADGRVFLPLSFS